MQEGLYFCKLINGNDDGDDDESCSSSSWPIQPVHVCTFWAEHLKISFDLVAICIGTGSEVCAQKVHVIRRSQISTGLKTVFKPDWSTKQEKTWKHFLKHSLFQRWIENIVSVSTWQRPCELMMALSGIFLVSFLSTLLVMAVNFFVTVELPSFATLRSHLAAKI